MPRYQAVTRSAKASKSIPDLLRWGLPDRIHTYAKKHFRGKFTHIDVRFHGQLCYFDVYSDDAVRTEFLPPPDTREYRDHLKLHADKANHLCRLRYTGRGDDFEFEFFSYSTERYEPSYLPSGSPTGSPEEAFDLAANLYL